jgi:hypothetical protein
MLSPVLRVVSQEEYMSIFQLVINHARYRKIVEKVLLQAEEGDFKSQRLIIEQVQGKPTQRISLDDNPDPALAQIQKLLADAGQPVEWKVTEEIEVEEE